MLTFWRISQLLINVTHVSCYVDYFSSPLLSESPELGRCPIFSFCHMCQGPLTWLQF